MLNPVLFVCVYLPMYWVYLQLSFAEVYEWLFFLQGELLALQIFSVYKTYNLSVYI
jgi:hypothetical protein